MKKSTIPLINQLELRKRLLSLIPYMSYSKSKLASSIGITRVTLNSFLIGKNVDLKRASMILQFIEKKASTVAIEAN